jgi:GMP synthase (glutamine-hydrolysing)
MTILIINNYYKKRNLNKANQVSQALRKIGKSKHEIRHFSEITKKSIKDNIEAIVLSGSAAHLQNPDQASMYSAEVEIVRKVDIPIFGICFGHQLVGNAFGSQIHALPQPIRSFISVKIIDPNEIFSSWKKGAGLTLCQSHQDCLTNIPEGFIRLAASESSKIEAMKHEKKPIYGVQAHVERATNEHPDGWQILRNFISNVAVK